MLVSSINLLIEKFMRRMKNATFNEIISLSFTDMNRCVMLALWTQVIVRKRVGNRNLTRNKKKPLLNPTILVWVMYREEKAKELWMVASKHDLS